MKRRRPSGPPPRGLLLAFLLALSLPGAGIGAQTREADLSPGGANPPLGGDFPAASFPDNWEARRELKESLVLAARGAALRWKDRAFVSGSTDARVRVILQGEHFYVVFENKRGGRYVTYSQGSWVVKRARADGAMVQAKVFLRSDPGVFARIYPFKDRCKMEVVLYGAVVHKDVILPVPFEELLGQPFARIMGYADAWVDWGFISPEPALYRDQSAMVAAIRAGIKGLEYRDDGALDERGRAVLIADGREQGAGAGLNCSGFAKWIVDGLYAPLVRERTAEGDDPGPLLLPIAPLKERHTGLRGTSFSLPYEESRDPYFGLDWIRNLGLHLSRALYPGRPAGPGDLDVTVHPFSQVTGIGEVLNTRLPYDPYPDFAPNVGYLASGLKPLLYKLAIQDPGAFYLGAYSTDEGGREPSLFQYFHIAAFFPRFDQDGIFRVDVFESGAETSLESAIRKRRDEKRERFIFLVRLPASSRVDYAAASGELIGPGGAAAPAGAAAP